MASTIFLKLGEAQGGKPLSLLRPFAQLVRFLTSNEVERKRGRGSWSPKRYKESTYFSVHLLATNHSPELHFAPYWKLIYWRLLYVNQTSLHAFQKHTQSHPAMCGRWALFVPPFDAGRALTRCWLCGGHDWFTWGGFRLGRDMRKSEREREITFKRENGGWQRTKLKEMGIEVFLRDCKSLAHVRVCACASTTQRSTVWWKETYSNTVNQVCQSNRLCNWNVWHFLQCTLFSQLFSSPIMHSLLKANVTDGILNMYIGSMSAHPSSSYNNGPDACYCVWGRLYNFGAVVGAFGARGCRFIPRN